MVTPSSGIIEFSNLATIAASTNTGSMARIKPILA
eukprot:CAMPEP_0198154070 /NCGR_PEP_ID=MMETSP1443-20131203/67150_1 /TAXON_ID=186043 /ORGANISM="Entomoneis sp., Strain CCMP2396" /LENGTH=34 /DNA_ID= /DNA_START= /DNA_END= /DNA_ORIENTATION=